MMSETHPEHALVVELCRIADDVDGFDWRRPRDFPGFTDEINAWPGADVESWPKERLRLLNLLEHAFTGAMLATARHPAAGKELEQFLRQAESTLQLGIDGKAVNEPGWQPPSQTAIVMARLDLMRNSLWIARSKAYASDEFLAAYRDAIVRHGYAPVLLSFRSPSNEQSEMGLRYRTKAELESEFPGRGTDSLVELLTELPMKEHGLLTVYRRVVERGSNGTKVVPYYAPNTSGARLVELLAQAVPAQ